MKQEAIHPYELVAKAIGVEVENINENSEVYKTSNWDSIVHLDVIEQIEINYNIKIPDEKLMEYGKMKKIIEAYDSFIKK